MFLPLPRPLLAALCLAPTLALAQEAARTLPVADNLVADGIPPVPAAIADAAAQYTEFRATGLADFHPTRRELLIGTRFGNTIQAHVVRMPGGARTQLTFFADPVSGATYEPTKGEYFLFNKGAGGNENFQIFRLDLQSGKTTLLTDGKSRHSGPRFSRSGKSIAYTSNARNKVDVDIYTMDPLKPETAKLIAENKGGGWAVADWSPDEKQLLVAEYISINESYLWLVDAATGARTPLTPRDAKEKVAYGAAAFARDGKGVYVTTDKDSEFQRLCYLDLATKTHKFIGAAVKWDVDGMNLSDDGSKIAYTTNEDGISVIRILDLKTNKELPAPKLAPGDVGAMRWNKAGTELAYAITSARAPSDVYSFTLATQKTDRWTEGETGGLVTKDFSEAKLVRWPSFDKREISGFLYQPPAKFTGKRPVIINIHGGPEAQARPIYLGRNNYYLNELGCAIVFPNVRGSSGYGKTFLTLDNGKLREDSYKDIAALLDWIKTQPQLDADRVLVTGGSYGGHMTFAIATYYPDRIRAALPVVGMSSLVTFLKNTEGYRRDLRRVEYGDERDPDMEAFLQRIAPLNKVDQIKAPMLVVQGKNDPRVPYTESEQIVETLKKKNQPVWYLLAKDEGHGFQKKANADFQFYSTILFMQKYLLEPAPKAP